MKRSDEKWSGALSIYSYLKSPMFNLFIKLGTLCSLFKIKYIQQKIKDLKLLFIKWLEEKNKSIVVR